MPITPLKPGPTFRVVEQDLPEGGKERLQQELREDPNTRFFLMGWTVEEANQMLEVQP